LEVKKKLLRFASEPESYFAVGPSNHRGITTLLKEKSYVYEVRSTWGGGAIELNHG